MNYGYLGEDASLNKDMKLYEQMPSEADMKLKLKAIQSDIFDSWSRNSLDLPESLTGDFMRE